MEHTFKVGDLVRIKRRKTDSTEGLPCGIIVGLLGKYKRVAYKVNWYTLDGLTIEYQNSLTKVS